VIVRAYSDRNGAAISSRRQPRRIRSDRQCPGRGERSRG